MHDDQIQTIAAINSGSSSLKFGLFPVKEPMQMIVKGVITGIGTTGCRFVIEDGNEKEDLGSPAGIDNVEKAAGLLVQWLKQTSPKYELNGIGHRVVHGGIRLSDPQAIDHRLIEKLEQLIPLAPLHLPAAISIIKVFKESFPGISQVACFDTAFHANMPFEAKHYAIPRPYWREGIIRYGFHGISCEYIQQQLQAADDRLFNKKIIIAHLGAGSSITAIKDGRSIENTMGFTPAGGLVMNTRAGDIDPGVAIYLLKEKKVRADQLEDIFNKQSGLKALAGSGESMEQLLENEASDPNAAQAVLLYCYHVKKQIAALTATLGGLDVLVFTGGIGEHSSVIRQRACEGLEFMGIELNKELNEHNAENISELPSRVQVFVMATNEELMIAKHARKHLEQYQ